MKKYVVLFLIVSSILSCEREDIGPSLSGMYVRIIKPFQNDALSDSVEFVGFLSADTLDDITQLQARWISDKDGVLSEQRMDKTGYSTFKTNQLSRNIHEITFEVSNLSGAEIHATITLYNIIHLKATGNGFSNKIEWDAPANVKNIKLYRSQQVQQIKEDLPIFKSDVSGQSTVLDSTAILNLSYAYQIFADVDGKEIYSNYDFARAGMGFNTNYPLSKVIFDPKRNLVCGIVSPESRYDDNETGYGLVFIDTETMKPERVLESIRFNDLDIDPQGDKLYVSYRNRKIYKIDLNTRQVDEIIATEHYIRKLEVGNNNRVYFHVENAANDSYEFRIFDLVTKQELPYKSQALDSFHEGDMELDNTTNTIYFSGPAMVTTEFDIFSKAIGSTCCSAPRHTIFKNGLLFTSSQVFDKDLNFLGNFLNYNGYGSTIHDVNEDGTLALGSGLLFNVNDQSIRKQIPAYYDKAIFIDDNRMMLISDSNPQYLQYRSLIQVYPYASK